MTQEIKEAINLVVNEVQQQAKVDYCSVGQMVAVAKEMGFDTNTDDLDMNGWDADYWQYCYKDDKKYCISGSGYYGGAIFDKAEEQDA